MTATAPDEGQIPRSALHQPMQVETIAETRPDSLDVRSGRHEVRTLPEGRARGGRTDGTDGSRDSGFPHDGDGALLRLGRQAHALRIA